MSLIIQNKLAVLLTTYNGEKYLIDTIKGIINSIIEFGQAVPLYVFDDYSTDESIQVIIDNWTLDLDLLRIYKSNFNRGLYNNKNYAFSILKEKYEFVFLIHQDDVPFSDWIKETSSILTKNEAKNSFVIWSSYHNKINGCLKENGDIRGIVEVVYPDLATIRQYIMKIYTPYSISGSLLNTRLCEKINFFDDKFKHFGDTAFIVNGLLSGYCHIYIAKPLILRNQGVHQASNHHSKLSRDIKEFEFYFGLYSKYLSVSQKFFFFRLLMSFAIRRYFKQLKNREFDISWNTLGYIKNLILISFNFKYSSSK